MITQLRNKETGFSLLELSVAVGVAAIVAAGAITATTTFIGGAAEKRDNYVSNAETSIENAESSSLALGAAGVVETVPEIDLSGLTFGITAFAQESESVVGNRSETWTESTPVLIIQKAPYLDNDLYSFISLLAAQYTIDYYDGSGYELIDGTYYIESSGVFDILNQYEAFTYYSANPTSGPADKLVINWEGVAPGGK